MTHLLRLAQHHENFIGDALGILLPDGSAAGRRAARKIEAEAELAAVQKQIESQPAAGPASNEMRRLLARTDARRYGVLKMVSPTLR